MLSGAGDPQRRWRLLCRDAEHGASIDVPVYCGDDGSGAHVRRPDSTTGRVPDAVS